ncbi:MAG: hypothetical protein ABGX51_06615, partial [Gammaproteobacteria bacterium]
ASKDSYERFYSQLKKAIKQAPEKVFTSGTQIKAWLKGNAPKLGIKTDEIYWSGIYEWLDIQKEKVSKADVVNFLNDNGVQVETVVLGKSIPYEKEYEAARQAVFKAVKDNVSDKERIKLIRERDGFESKLDKYMEDNPDEDYESEKYTGKHNTKGLTLPGGKDYQELVLTIPTTDKFNENDETHFGDTGEGKQIAWIRHNTRQDSQGNNTLFIEEVQSQRGSDGRKSGFKAKLTAKDVNIENIPSYVVKTGAWKSKYVGLVPSEISSIFFETKEKAQSFADSLNNNATSRSKSHVLPDKVIAYSASFGHISLKRLSKEQAINDVLSMYADYGLAPAAPFVTDSNNKATDAYITLMLKQAISHAIDNGHRSVSWTTGDQQADRYDLSKMIKQVTTERRSDNTVKLIAYDHNDSKVLNETLSSQDKIADYVGKEVAERLIEEMDSSNGKADIRDSNLKIGGDWTKTMYGDERGHNANGEPSLVMQAARQIAKKMGGRVGSVELNTGTQPALLITDKMKDKIQREGMPLFSKAPKFSRSSDAASKGAEKLANGEITKAEYGKYNPADDILFSKFDPSRRKLLIGASTATAAAVTVAVTPQIMVGDIKTGK